MATTVHQALMEWISVHRSGVVLRATGPDGWEKCFTHEDVTEAGRLEVFGFRDAWGRQTLLMLKPDERAYIARRSRLGIGGVGGGVSVGALSSATVLGIVQQDGSGVYCIIDDNGLVTVASDLNAV